MGSYEGKRAVIVGGTHGIGLAIAEQLVHGGATVVVSGRNPDNARAAGDALGPAATAVAGDVTNPGDVAELADRAGEVDALFMNVGIGEDAPFADVTEAFWDRQFDVNAKGAFFAAQRLVPHVRAGGGIVFTTLMASTAYPGGAVYAATKAAVRAFAHTLAAELVTRDIRVNTVAPGFIDTPTFGITDATPEQRAELQAAGRAATPMKRLGTAAEVARAAIFLALEATFTTGRSCRWTAASRASPCRTEPAPARACRRPRRRSARRTRRRCPPSATARRSPPRGPPGRPARAGASAGRGPRSRRGRRAGWAIASSSPTAIR